MAQLPSELVRATATIQNGVALKAVQTVSRLLPTLEGLDSPTAGGAMRTIATGVVDRFGDLSVVLASDQYAKLRAAGVGYKAAIDQVRLQNDMAAWVAQMQAAKAVHVDKAVGRAMAKFSQGMTAQAELDLSSSVGLAVKNMFRETMTNAASNDSAVSGYQRVASASACAFCATVALNQYTSFADDDGYHDHCGCTTVPIFKGLDAFRPAYYDTFQAEYDSAFASVNSSKTEDILAALRLESGRS